MNERPDPAATPTHVWQRLLRAAESLLDARANLTVTGHHWRELRDAAAACWLPDSATQDAVPAGSECPQCHQRDPDQLVWLDDERVQCRACGTTYEPGGENRPSV